jgi:hypothetical protein
MSNEKKQYTPEELHQRQTWVEIWLPLLIGLAVIAAVVALLILAAVHGSSSIAQWSAISLILFIDYWLIRGNRALPAYAQNIRQKVDIVAGKIQSILTSIIAFFLKVDNIIEMLKSFLAHSSGSDK